MSYDLLQSRQQAGQNGGQQLLNLLADPFSSEVNSTSFNASLAWSLGGSVVLALLFCFLRPRTNAVYAPRAKHADEKHAPPKLDSGLLSWVGPIKNIKETQMVSIVGLDAVIFLRFMRMLRNMFVFITILGLAVVIPVCLYKPAFGPGGTVNTTKRDVAQDKKQIAWLIRVSPQWVMGGRFWAYTILAYAFDLIVCGFIWWNYRAILRLRRNYLQSPEYHSSLYARTLMITHVPPAMRTDEGLIRIIADTNATRETPKTAIARNVKDLPELIEEHDKAVHTLEKVLAKYLANPDRLPAKRPTCKPFKSDRARDAAREVDAIEYLTGRIREVEKEVQEVRDSIDKRNPMPFGFASYMHVEDAHVVAFAARKKGPQGTTIKLAPKPNDIIWKNIGMSPRTRRTRSVWNGIWMILLTIAYIIPNILTAVFLSDFANLASLWGGFATSYQQHRTLWGILQGILAPLIQALFYLALPTIFRRLLSKSGDPTKTSRERHVASRLFGFYIFNQLIVFSLFAAIWRFFAAVIEAGTSNQDVWKAISNYHVFTKLVAGLCNTAPFWITWALQRNLGAAVDISQLWPLIWGSMLRKFGSPTPRQNIELSAPPPFDYASYYNSFLFSATVGLCFATLNPVILPVTLLYLTIDCWLKKYLLLYVAITKVESGGMFWRMAINRLLIGLVISNVVIAVVVGAQGVITLDGATNASGVMLYAMIPLPFLLIGFKLYLRRAFDDKIRYYKTKSGMRDVEHAPTEPSDKKILYHRDRVGIRFGDPVLWRKLKTPMVSAKAQHILPQIYTGRTDENEMAAMRAAAFGQADVYMANMDNQAPGKATKSSAPFELVGESEQDFEYFKRRAEFREEFGGEGELYSRPSSRATSLASMSTLMGPGGLPHVRKGSDSPSSSRASSRTRAPDDAAGVTYPRGYAAPMRAESPSAMYRQDSSDIATAGHPAFRGNDSHERLTDFAGGMGHNAPQYAPYRPDSPGDYHGAGPYTPGQYSDGPRYGSNGGTPYEDDNTSYDYFRRGRPTGR